MIIAATVVLLLLHGPNGHDILLNPDAVTSMHAAVPGKKQDLVTENARCYINTSDGKFVTVAETCDQVRAILKEIYQ